MRKGGSQPVSSRVLSHPSSGHTSQSTPAVIGRTPSPRQCRGGPGALQLARNVRQRCVGGPSGRPGRAFPCQPKGGRQSCRARGAVPLCSEGATPALSLGPSHTRPAPAPPLSPGWAGAQTPRGASGPNPSLHGVPLRAGKGCGGCRPGLQGASALVSLRDEGASVPHSDSSARDHTSLLFSAPVVVSTRVQVRRGQREG